MKGYNESGIWCYWQKMDLSSQYLIPVVVKDRMYFSWICYNILISIWYWLASDSSLTVSLHLWEWLKKITWLCFLSKNLLSSHQMGLFPWRPVCRILRAFSSQNPSLFVSFLHNSPLTHGAIGINCRLMNSCWIEGKYMNCYLVLLPPLPTLIGPQEIPPLPSHGPVNISGKRGASPSF